LRVFLFVWPWFLLWDGQANEVGDNDGQGGDDGCTDADRDDAAVTPAVLSVGKAEMETVFTEV
jgi:hypothetical protein